MNKRIIIVTSIIFTITIFSLATLKLYNTYALSNNIDSTSNNIHNIVVTDNSIVEIPANSTKDVFYMVNNTSPGTVSYNVGYTTNYVISVEYYNTGDPAFGSIDENERKYIKLRITNSSENSKTITLSTILGYVNGGNLIVPSGITLIEDAYTTLAEHITSLYTNDGKIIETINNIEYYYANLYDKDDDDTTSGGLMNDRLGGTATDYNGGNIRYYGANPNNYIYFNCSDYSYQNDENCEVWRIIGVFDGKVKIIRGSSIGTYAWDNKNTSTGAEGNFGENDWKTARLMKLLNPSDYYTIDSNDNSYGQSLYYNGQSGTCFSGQYNATTTCNFTSTGLKNDTTRNLISEETYYLRGSDSAEVYPDAMYNYERTTGSVYNTSRPTSWTGKIALAYPSDYGYAVSYYCTQTLDNYSTCASNNWMKSILGTASFSWLLTPYSDQSYLAWYVTSFGDIVYGNHATYDALGVIPVLYLNSDLTVEEGTTGESGNPYMLIA